MPAINIIRRIWQASGAAVIHPGHNRSLHDIVTALPEEGQTFGLEGKIDWMIEVSAERWVMDTSGNC